MKPKICCVRILVVTVVGMSYFLLLQQKLEVIILKKILGISIYMSICLSDNSSHILNLFE